MSTHPDPTPPALTSTTPDTACVITARPLSTALDPPLTDAMTSTPAPPPAQPGAGRNAAVTPDVLWSDRKTNAARMGNSVGFTSTDVTDEADVQAACANTTDLGGQDIVINCTGIALRARTVSGKSP